MASGFQGSGDVLGGGSATRGGPIQVSYQQRPEVGVSAGGGGLQKRQLVELQRQQPLPARSVRQKTTALPPQGSPLSHMDLCFYSPSASAVTASGSSPSFHLHGEAPPSFSVPPRNGGYVYLQQQQRQQGYYARPSHGINLPLPAGSQTVMEQPRAEVKLDGTAFAMKSKLRELEEQLLGDDDNDEGEVSISGSVATATDWSETMQNLLSPCSFSASSPKSTLSPSPSSTCSSSSSSSPSCCPPSRQLLLDAASAIADGNMEVATASLDRLQKSSAANPRGDTEQRLTAHMIAALQARINSLSSPVAPCSFPAAELCSVEHLRSTRMLYESSPCFYLGFVAANLAILEAARGHSKIHIVDFDIGQGLQYAALVNTLAELPPSSGRPAIRVTAVADPTLPRFHQHNSSSTSTFLKMVGERIGMQAEHAGVDLRLNVLARRASDLDPATLGCAPDEALAVNLAFLLSRLPDESVTPDNPRDQLLRQARSLSPQVVTLVEQEMNCNTAPFTARFAEASAYCRALFESLEAAAPRDGADRLRVEECLARRAANAVAHEGPDRVERCEVLGKWRARMAMAGYRPAPLGPSVVEPVRARLACRGPGFTLKEDSGAVCLGWADRVLTVTSAWR